MDNFHSNKFMFTICRRHNTTQEHEAAVKPWPLGTKTLLFTSESDPHSSEAMHICIYVYIFYTSHLIFCCHGNSNFCHNESKTTWEVRHFWEPWTLCTVLVCKGETLHMNTDRLTFASAQECRPCGIKKKKNNNNNNNNKTSEFTDW